MGVTFRPNVLLYAGRRPAAGFGRLRAAAPQLTRSLCQWLQARQPQHPPPPPHPPRGEPITSPAGAAHKSAAVDKTPPLE
jgi:hypothetical protein